MKINLIAILGVFSIGFLASGCSSPIGGTLIGFDREPVPGALVRLNIIDDEGDTLENVDYTITDGKGHFGFSTNDNMGSQFVVEAVLPNGRLRAFACGTGSRTDLNPVTDAIVQAVLYVTEGNNGTELSDFSSKEIEKIVKEAGNSENLWEMSFEEDDELARAVINKAGMLIPEAAGGAVSAVPIADVELNPTVTNPDPVFETALPDHPCGKDNYWIESSLFGFDLLQDGSLCKGVSNTLGLFSPYGIAYQLRIEGDTFKDPVTNLDTGSGAFPGDPEVFGINPPDAFIEDYRKVCFGPVETVSGLSVTRKIYIPEAGDFARYSEIFSNPTDGDITISIKVRGGIGIGEFVVYGTGILTLTEQSGDLIIGTEDSWAASVDATNELIKPHPAVGFVWDGLSGSDRVDLVSFPPANGSQDFDYWWNDVTIPAQSTKIYMYYSYLSGYRIASVLEDLLENAYMSPDESLMSTAELNSIQNFAVTRGNVTGEAGSVPSFSDLLISNETRSALLAMKARQDGGFSANIDSESGDIIKVTVSIEGATAVEKSITVP
jgi:hypothetical protein